MCVQQPGVSIKYAAKHVHIRSAVLIYTRISIKVRNVTELNSFVWRHVTVFPRLHHEGCLLNQWSFPFESHLWYYTDNTLLVIVVSRLNLIYN